MSDATIARWRGGEKAIFALLGMLPGRKKNLQASLGEGGRKKTGIPPPIAL